MPYSSVLKGLHLIMSSHYMSYKLIARKVLLLTIFFTHDDIMMFSVIIVGCDTRLNTLNTVLVHDVSALNLV